MHSELYLGFIAASTILILIPGPNVSLIVANSIAHGTRYGLLTVVGTSSAILVQLALTALGLSATLGTLAGWFDSADNHVSTIKTGDGFSISVTARHPKIGV